MNFLSQLIFDLCNILYAGENKRAKTSGILVCIILFFDLHRYGAWYTGNRAHIKPYGYIMLIIASMPFCLLILKKALHFYVKASKSMTIKINSLYAGIIGFILTFTIAYVTQDFSRWYWLDEKLSLFYWSRNTYYFLALSAIIGFLVYNGYSKDQK